MAEYGIKEIRTRKRLSEVLTAMGRCFPSLKELDGDLADEAEIAIKKGEWQEAATRMDLARKEWRAQVQHLGLKHQWPPRWRVTRQLTSNGNGSFLEIISYNGRVVIRVAAYAATRIDWETPTLNQAERLLRSFNEEEEDLFLIVPPNEEEEDDFLAYCARAQAYLSRYIDID